MIRKSRKIKIIPVVFNTQCTRKKLSELKSVDLSGDFCTWWGALRPIFGRPAGDIHSLITQKAKLDDMMQAFQADFTTLKSLLLSLPDDKLADALRITNKYFNVETLMQEHCSTNSPSPGQKWPTSPQLNKGDTCSWQTTRSVGYNDICASLESFRIRNVSALQPNPGQDSASSKLCPFSKQIHVYFIHNDDAKTLTILNLMIACLTCNGYKCFTWQDVPPGEHILDFTIKAIERSTATAVVDFLYLKTFQNRAAKYAAFEFIKSNTKFIPVYSNTEEHHGNESGLYKYIDKLITPLDVTDHHTKWLPKLLALLETPYDFKSGISCTVETGQCVLSDINMTLKKMKNTLHHLQPKLKRYAMYLLTKDNNFVKFLQQCNHKETLEEFSKSHPPINSGRQPLQTWQTFSDISSSPSSNDSEESSSGMAIPNSEEYCEVEFDGCGQLDEPEMFPFACHRFKDKGGYTPDSVIDTDTDDVSDISQNEEDATSGLGYAAIDSRQCNYSRSNSATSSGYGTIPKSRPGSECTDTDSRSESILCSQDFNSMSNYRCNTPNVNQKRTMEKYCVESRVVIKNESSQSRLLNERRPLITSLNTGYDRSMSCISELDEDKCKGGRKDDYHCCTRCWIGWTTITLIIGFCLLIIILTRLIIILISEEQ